MSNAGRQLVVFATLLATNAFLAFLALALGLQEQAFLSQGVAAPLPSVPTWLLGLANAGLILVLYGLLGLAGFWFARKLGLPGVYRENAGWRNWLIAPMVLGVVVGVLIVLADRVFASAGAWEGFEHPPFPLSLIASATAGIGEEVVFRAFVLGLWAFLLNLVFRRWGATKVALWAGNLLGALAFGAAHLPSAMFLLGVPNPAGIPPLVLSELFLLNGIIGLVAGERYIRDGLVAAVGVHFWADIVWHVAWPLAAAG